MPTPPLIIFVHIPKTAGTTLNRIVRLKYGFWPPDRLLHHRRYLGFYHLRTNAERIAAIAALPERQKRKIRLYHGHFGFGLHESLPQPSAYVTFLREPVARVVSCYHQLRGEPDSPLRGASLADYAHAPANHGRFFFDNGQVRALAGAKGEPLSAPLGACTRADLKRAQDNIENHFVLAGLTERFDASLVLLKLRLGWKRCYYVSANIRKRATSEAPPAPEVLEKIRAANTLDQELYEWTMARHERAIRELGPAFTDAMAAFERGNRRHTRLFGPFARLLDKLRGR